MAEAGRFALMLMLAIASASAIAQNGIPSEAVVAPRANQKVSDPGAQEQASRQEERVRLVWGHACADPATQVVPVATFRDDVESRLITFDTPGYRASSVIERKSVAEYPAELLRSNTPGAVGVLLFIEVDGNVSRILSPCATDPAFVPFAEQVVWSNRYRPSTIAGQPVPDLAYQIVAYGVAED